MEGPPALLVTPAPRVRIEPFLVAAVSVAAATVTTSGRWGTTYAAVMVIIAVAHVVGVRSQRAAQANAQVLVGRVPGPEVVLLPTVEGCVPRFLVQPTAGGPPVGVVGLPAALPEFDPWQTFRAWGTGAVGTPIGFTSVDGRALVLPMTTLRGRKKDQPALTVRMSETVGWPPNDPGTAARRHAQAMVAAAEMHRRKRIVRPALKVIPTGLAYVAFAHLGPALGPAQGLVVAAVWLLAGGLATTATQAPVAELVQRTVPTPSREATRTAGVVGLAVLGRRG